MSCYFKACPYPPTFTVRDINGDVAVCAHHRRFLSEEKGLFDSGIRSVYLEDVSRSDKHFWAGEGMVLCPRSPRNNPRTLQEYTRPSASKTKEEVQQERGGTRFIKDQAMQEALRGILNELISAPILRDKITDRRQAIRCLSSGRHSCGGELRKHGTDHFGRRKFLCKTCNCVITDYSELHKKRGGNHLTPLLREMTVRLLMTPGASIRGVAHKVGIARNTVRRIYKSLDATASCPCGGKAGHNGWCAFRFNLSAKRQYVVNRWREKRQLCHER